MNGLPTLEVKNTDDCPEGTVQRGEDISEIDGQKCYDIYGAPKDPIDWEGYY